MSEDDVIEGSVLFRSRACLGDVKGAYASFFGLKKRDLILTKTHLIFDGSSEKIIIDILDIDSMRYKFVPFVGMPWVVSTSSKGDCRFMTPHGDDYMELIEEAKIALENQNSLDGFFQSGAIDAVEFAILKDRLIDASPGIAGLAIDYLNRMGRQENGSLEARELKSKIFSILEFESYALERLIETRVVPQAESPLKIGFGVSRELEASEDEFFRIESRCACLNQSDSGVNVMQIGLIIFDCWNNLICHGSGLDSEYLAPSEDRSMSSIFKFNPSLGSVPDFAFFYLRKVRFSNGVVWSADMKDVERYIKNGYPSLKIDLLEDFKIEEYRHDS